MIDLFENLLRQLLIEEVAELTDEAQVRFQPPDADWRAYVSNLVIGTNPVNALNVYLADMRENRKLRSNERARTIENGVINEEPTPARLDCHYLISAWSPAAPSPSVEPTLDEQALLYQVAAVLMQRGSLNPSRIYPAGSAALNAWPAAFHEVELPIVIAPVEGFAKLAEFWSGMGPGAFWKPVLYLIVTLPVTLLREVAGPMVTTRITEYRISGSSTIAEVLIEIGGHLLLPPQAVAVGNAVVTAINTDGTRVTVNNAAPFRVGDAVTQNNIQHAVVIQRAGNDLTLSRQLTGLVNGSTLRIANISPSQNRFRLGDLTGISGGGTVLISGDDATKPGTAVTERAEIQDISAGGLVMLAVSPLRTRTFNLNAQPANAPVVRALASGVWVRLEDAGGASLQETTTNAEGRFKFTGLSEGNYVLRVRAQGFAEAIHHIVVPSATGNYDVQL